MLTIFWVLIDVTQYYVQYRLEVTYVGIICLQFLYCQISFIREKYNFIPENNDIIVNNNFFSDRTKFISKLTIEMQSWQNIFRLWKLLFNMWQNLFHLWIFLFHLWQKRNSIVTNSFISDKIHLIPDKNILNRYSNIQEYS